MTVRVQDCSSGPPRLWQTRRRLGFTLIELVSVLGVLVLLIAIGGFALSGRGGEGAALASAQSIVTSLVQSTRAQAALHQRKARLVVYAQQPPGANADAAKYLRVLQVLRDESGNGDWVAAGDPVTLPAPVCVVPPPPVPANHLRAGVTWVNNAATGPVSTGLSTLQAGFSYRGQRAAPGRQFFGATGQNGRVHFLEFDPDGTVANAGSNPVKLVVATAVLAGNAVPQFNNANGVRGLVVRRSGAVALVNDATGF